MNGQRLLRAEDTCRSTALADRAALLVDMACYFEAAKAAMLKAEHSIHFLNWAFEQDTFLIPGPDCTGDESDRIGNFLKRLGDENAHLDIRILCWDSAMPVAATQRFFRCCQTNRNLSPVNGAGAGEGGSSRRASATRPVRPSGSP